MTQEQIEQLGKMIVSGLSPYLVIGGVFFAAMYGLWKFVEAWATRRGFLLAEIEGAPRLTRLLERTRSKFTYRLEAHRAHYQMRVAIIDRQLDTHQKAYAMWWKLMWNIHEKTIQEVANECRTWWVNNCVYMDPAARDAFISAVNSAATHHHYTNTQAAELPEIGKKTNENWDRILLAGNKILETATIVPLPPEIQEETKNSNKK